MVPGGEGEGRVRTEHALTRHLAVVVSNALAFRKAITPSSTARAPAIFRAKKARDVVAEAAVEPPCRRRSGGTEHRWGWAEKRS